MGRKEWGVGVGEVRVVKGETLGWGRNVGDKHKNPGGREYAPRLASVLAIYYVEFQMQGFFLRGGGQALRRKLKKQGNPSASPLQFSQVPQGPEKEGGGGAEEYYFDR